MRIINTPIEIKNMKLANRLVMPPMATAKSSEEGFISDALLDYYAQKSEGGYIALIITEHSYISKEGKAHPGQMSLDVDCDMPGLRRLTDIIHTNGTKVFCQLSHSGGMTTCDTTDYELLSASSVPMPNEKISKKLAREMNMEDIQKVIRAFASAALRAKEAGYDGVEIHSAHGYLLNQFYSPLTNKRNDEYTGSTIEGRTKLQLQIIDAVRAAVGEDFPIALRLGACDYMEGGTTIEDSVEAAITFEKAGVDLLDITGGFCTFIHPTKKDQGYFSELSEKIKAKVSVPVILTGGITDIQAAEQLLQKDCADMIGVGRAIFKDSSWARRAMETKI